MSKTNHNKAECLKMFARMSEYIDNELDEMTCRDIERHMANCPPCRICLATLNRTVLLCRKMKDQPVPQTLSSKLKRLIDDLTP